MVGGSGNTPAHQLCLLVDLGDDRVSCEERGGGTVRWLHLALSIDLRQQRVRADTKHAQLAARLRRTSTGFTDRQRGTRAAAQPPGCLDDLAGTCVVHWHSRGLHPTGCMGLWTPDCKMKREFPKRKMEVSIHAKIHLQRCTLVDGLFVQSDGWAP